MHPSWKVRLGDEFTKLYFEGLVEFVRGERRSHTVFPPPSQTFEAFELTPFDDTRVVILGQDPYHNAGQAHGLSFSVPPGVKPPPSLANIYRELAGDVGFKVPTHGCLTPWARRGVLLLNAVLTVRAHEPGSHRDRGWETFTDAVLRALGGRQEPVVFVLWGSYARVKKALLDSSKHTVIESPHPSPMSARSGFFGSRPFSRVNAALRGFGHPEIDWRLPTEP